ncbi:MAG: tRNA (adenosine(37)-N6)-dimethylallyltransferase MiaA [Actinomycetota bacterium]
MAPTPPILALVGPTASGKTDAAIELARAFGAEVVSVDSMLVYRGMDVGTAKPTRAQRAVVPHHLIDLAEPSESFSVARYQALGREALEGIGARDGRALLAGGSGLYFRAIVDDLEFPGTDAGTRGELEAEASVVGAASLYRRLADTDPVAAAKIEPENVRRTIRALEVAALTGRPFSSYGEAWTRYPPDRVRAAGVRLPADVLRARIGERVREMQEAGFIEEVRGLLARGFGAWLTSTQAIGYAEFAAHLGGRLSLDEALERTVSRTRQLARRQMAWFRRDPRIRWFDAGAGGALDLVDEMRVYLGAAEPA